MHRNNNVKALHVMDCASVTKLKSVSNCQVTTTHHFSSDVEDESVDDASSFGQKGIRPQVQKNNNNYSNYAITM